jgi:predicted dehydrogenase
MSRKKISRREFVADAGKFGLGAMIVPRHILGGVGYRAPSATLNVACVGIGGMGMNNMKALFGENIVAICDVDFGYVERKVASEVRPRTGAITPRQGQTQAEANEEAARQDAEKTRLKEVYAKATKYTDWRVMLEKQKDIDAIVVATPDHCHAVIANSAMKLGKHVYVQKPMAYSVHEARTMARTAREMRVVTQMGNQGHSQEGTRRIRELIQSGIIGPVREVHIYTDRPQRYWAQGLPRPGQGNAPANTAGRGGAAGAAGAASAATGTTGAAANAGRGGQPAAPAQPAPDPNVPQQWNTATVDRAILEAMSKVQQTPPPGMDWNLFLGPAREIPYHPVYHPFSWRGWVEFGVGALGDMGAHLVDQPYYALGLTQPVAITASSTPWGGPRNDPASYPVATTVEYEFAAHGSQPAVKMFWYDGNLLPPRPPFLPDDMTLPRGDGGGGVFIGDKGILTYETYGRNPKLFPESLNAEAERVPRTIERIEGERHEVNFARACKGEVTASSPFDYAAGLTETMLLGVAALRAAGPNGKRILYDAANMSFTNATDGNRFLTREYRAGWSL